MSDREGTEALNKQCREAARLTFDRMRAMLDGQSPAPIAGRAGEMPPHVARAVRTAREYRMAADHSRTPHTNNAIHEVTRWLADERERLQQELAQTREDARVGVGECMLIIEQQDRDRERLLARTTWQPISTAPKGKKAILAAYKYDRQWVIEVVEWDKKYCAFSGSRGAWIGFGLSGDEDSRELSPTHWMPLPAPPTEDTNASR